MNKLKPFFRGGGTFSSFDTFYFQKLIYLSARRCFNKIQKLASIAAQIKCFFSSSRKKNRFNNQQNPPYSNKSNCKSKIKKNFLIVFKDKANAEREKFLISNWQLLNCARWDEVFNTFFKV